MLNLSKIRIDGGTQARAELNQETVAEYAEVYRSGVSMPPVSVFYDGSTYWLADGFHRYFGAKQAGKETICEEVTPGTQRDAVLYSLGCNAKHGLRRSNADKRKAVETMLADPEWAGWSDSQVAKACGVDHKTVAAHRSSLGNSQVTEHVERTYTTKHGTVATMNTANVGKASVAPIRPAAVDASANEDAKPAPLDSTCTVGVGQSELEELRDRYDEMAASFKETLAENESMARTFDADDRVAAAMAEVKRFSTMNAVLESRNTGLANELAEVKRLLKIAQRRAERAEAALSKEAA